MPVLVSGLPRGNPQARHVVQHASQGAFRCDGGLAGFTGQRLTEAPVTKKATYTFAQNFMCSLAEIGGLRFPRVT